MFPTNFYWYFIVALIPLVTGAIYYHPKVLGSAWMKANNFTEEDLKGANMAKIFGLTYLLGLFLTMGLSGAVIHQGNVIQMMMTEGGLSDQAIQQASELLAQYGDNHRSFGHGALHGFLVSLMMALPIIGINALFERRSGKYIFIHFFYWAITMIIMGGLLCQFLHFPPLQ